MASSVLALGVPPLAGRVNDLAGLLPPGRARALDEKLARFEAETSHQVVLLTVPSLDGEPIEDFSMRVAEAWKPGQAGRDNGILVVVAPQERTARVEVGYGLEGAVPDAVASRILRQRMFPRFREGRMADGVEAGVDALLAAARGEALPAAPASRDPSVVHADPAAHLALAVLGGALAGAPFLGLYRSYRGGHKVNAMALKALLSDRSAYEIVESAGARHRVAVPELVAAPHQEYAPWRA